MNVSAIASLFKTEKTAGNFASKAASRNESTATPPASTEVTLTNGQPAEPLTYSANATAGSLLDRAKLLLPTRANAAMLAAQAGEAIGAKLDEAGIPRQPGFELTIDDVNSAHVTVKSNRPDAKAIEDLINGDQKLQMGVHNAYAIASGVPAMERATAFSREYAAAQSQAEIDAVVARYSDLFGGFSPAADIGLSFGKDGLQISINGETARA
jgi:hypothetical protein